MLNWLQKKKPVVVEPRECCQHSAPVAPTTGEWIAVTEQIPEYGVRVLTSSAEHGVVCGYRTTQSKDGDEWELGIVTYLPYSYYKCAVKTKAVTHWRPLPHGPGY